ncbi:MAG: hypothetical protein FWG50_10395 [Kiritimatiellaeota bacterium]|nr:hypothetical protein [Kiritimatiellota bacterium]
MASEGKQKFSLAGLIVVVVVALLFFSVLVAQSRSAMWRAGITATGARGRDIYIAIVGANTEREPLGLPSVWPKTVLTEDDLKHPLGLEDIAWCTFQNSTDYFYELYDGAHLGMPDHSPYVAGFDYSKLAGAGVRAMEGTGRLRSENNMWCIMGNIREEMADSTPVLVTRNVDCSSLRLNALGDPDEPIRWSQQYKTPFPNKEFTLVRKGGGMFNGTKKSARMRFVVPHADSVPLRDLQRQHPPVVYLTPDDIAHPQ